MTKCLQFNLYRRCYVFTVKIRFLLLCLFFISLFCALGTWQLHRYHYKKTLLATYQQHLTAAPIPFAQLTGSQNNLQFQQVLAAGQYVNALTFLIQNQLHQGKIGYEVVTPLRITGKQKLLLIDRGWVPQPTYQQLPRIEDVAGTQNIVGYIKYENEYHFILGKNVLQPNALPLVVQKIDIDELSHLTHHAFYPFIVRLSATQPHGYVRDWVIATVLPDRHFAYAVQWFVMALVLLFAYLGFSCEREPAKKREIPCK